MSVFSFCTLLNFIQTISSKYITYFGCIHPFPILPFKSSCPISDSLLPSPNLPLLSFLIYMTNRMHEIKQILYDKGNRGVERQYTEWEEICLLPSLPPILPLFLSPLSLPPFLYFDRILLYSLVWSGAHNFLPYSPQHGDYGLCHSP